MLFFLWYYSIGDNMSAQAAKLEEDKKKTSFNESNAKIEREDKKISFEEFEAKVDEFISLVNALFDSIEPEIANHEDLRDVYKSFYLLKYEVLSKENIKDIYDKDLDGLFLDRINTFESVLLGLQVELGVNTANRDYAKDKVRKNTRDIAYTTDVKSKFKKTSKARKKAIFSVALALSIIVNSSVISDLYINRKKYFDNSGKSTKNGTTVEEVIEKDESNEEQYDYGENQYTYKGGYDKGPRSDDTLLDESNSEVDTIDFKYATTTSYRVVQKIPNTENFYIVEEYSPVQVSGYRYKFVYYVPFDDLDLLLDADLSDKPIYHHETILGSDFNLVINRDASIVVRSYDSYNNESTFDYYSGVNSNGKRTKESNKYKNWNNRHLVPINKYADNQPSKIDNFRIKTSDQSTRQVEEEKKESTALPVKIALAATSSLLLQVLLVYLLIHRKEIPNAPSEIIKYMQRMNKYKKDLKQLLGEKDKLNEDYRSTEKIVNTICNRIDKTILKCKDQLSAVADNETIKSALAGAIESKNIYDIEVELKKKEIEDAMTRIKGQLASISENDMTAIEQLSYEEFNKYVKRKPVSERALFEKVDDHYVVREIFRDKLMFFNLAPISFNNVDISGLDFRLTNASINLDKVYAYDDKCKFGDQNLRFHLVH